MTEDFYGIVTENSVLELAVKEYNMGLLHDLFSTRDYLMKHFDLSDFDGIDQASIIYHVFQIVTAYQTNSGYTGLTIQEIFEDHAFQVKVDEYIDTYEETV